MTDQQDAGSSSPHGHDEHEHGHEHERGHGHEQGNEHGREEPVGGSRFRRLMARAGHALTPHSHDSAVKTDAALESSSRGMRVLAISFVALTVIAALVCCNPS